jgi:hypothetical protein
MPVLPSDKAHWQHSKITINPEQRNAQMQGQVQKKGFRLIFTKEKAFLWQ